MTEEIIVEEEKVTPDPALETSIEETQVKEDQEVLKKKEHLANLEAAIREESNKLKKLRQTSKEVNRSANAEEVPEIDEKDPSAQAWTKRINDSVNPVAEELEAQKTEVREYAIRKFLADKPALSKNPEAVRDLIATYGKIRTATERTTEGVETDLKRAYAALHADELIAEARGQRIATAQADAMHADIAISRGASSYKPPTKPKISLSQDDKLQLAKWGMTEAEWVEQKEKYQ